MLRAREQQLRYLEAELEVHRARSPNRLMNCALAANGSTHPKLMVAKYGHMIVGTRSEKIVMQLEQLELA